LQQIDLQKNMCQTLSIQFNSDFLYNLQNVWYENVSKLRDVFEK